MKKQNNLYKTALIQMRCRFLNLEENLFRAACLVRQAAENGATLVCLPEAFLTGYSADGIREMRELAVPMDSKPITTLKGLAAELGIFLLLPFLSQTHEGVKNRAVLVNPEGDLLGRYDKTHLIGEEKKYLLRGNSFPVWETEIGRIGCLICYDLCFPETVRTLTLKGAQIVLVPSAWRSAHYYTEWWDKNLACRALDNLVFLAGINHAGSQFAGHSKLCDPIGRILCESTAAKEEIVYGIIDLERLEIERAVNTVLEDRQTDLYNL